MLYITQEHITVHGPKMLEILKANLKTHVESYPASMAGKQFCIQTVENTFSMLEGQFTIMTIFVSTATQWLQIIVLPQLPERPARFYKHQSKRPYVEPSDERMRRIELHFFIIMCLAVKNSKAHHQYIWNTLLSVLKLLSDVIKASISCIRRWGLGISVTAVWCSLHGTGKILHIASFIVTDVNSDLTEFRHSSCACDGTTLPVVKQNERTASIQVCL